jgi:hypothetical protein
LPCPRGTLLALVTLNALEAGTMNLHGDRKTQQLSAESRRLWDDERVWVVNCLAVEAAWAAVPEKQRAEARRGLDRMLAAFIETW